MKLDGHALRKAGRAFLRPGKKAFSEIKKKFETGISSKISAGRSVKKAQAFKALLTTNSSQGLNVERKARPAAQVVAETGPETEMHSADFMAEYQNILDAHRADYEPSWVANETKAKDLAKAVLHVFDKDDDGSFVRFMGQLEETASDVVGDKGSSHYGKEVDTFIHEKLNESLGGADLSGFKADKKTRNNAVDILGPGLDPKKDAAARQSIKAKVDRSYELFSKFAAKHFHTDQGQGRMFAKIDSDLRKLNAEREEKATSSIQNQEQFDKKAATLAGGVVGAIRDGKPQQFLNNMEQLYSMVDEDNVADVKVFVVTTLQNAAQKSGIDFTGYDFDEVSKAFSGAPQLGRAIGQDSSVARAKIVNDMATFRDAVLPGAAPAQKSGFPGWNNKPVGSN